MWHTDKASVAIRTSAEFQMKAYNFGDLRKCSGVDYQPLQEELACNCGRPISSTTESTINIDYHDISNACSYSRDISTSINFFSPSRSTNLV
jgi:hypothetical protein